MKVLVTGAGGFVGSHLIEHLIASGDDVRALVHFRGDDSIGRLRYVNTNSIEVVHGDVRDAEALTRWAAGCESIYNLAAMGNPAYSVECPRHTVEVNIGGTLNALEAGRAVGARVLVMGSSEAYGTPPTRDEPMMPERTPLRPTSPYGASKGAADLLAYAYAHSYDAPAAIIVRCFNIYGPRQSWRALIPAVMRQATEKPNESIRISAAAFHALRDYTYVGDVVQALRKLVLTGNAPDPVTLASGDSLRLAEIAELAARAAGSMSSIESDTEQDRPAQSEVYYLCGDPSPLRSLIGPTTPLHIGLQLTAAWVHEILQ